MNRARKLFRVVYDRFPGKQLLFSLVRPIWVPPHFLRQRLSFKGVFGVKVGHEEVRLENDGFYIEQELFWCGLLGSWEKESLRLWMKLAETSSLMVDVGANTGVFALVAKAVNRSVQVAAVEPVPRIFDRLLSNVRRNDFEVHCIQAAASNRPGEIVLYDLEHSHHYIATVRMDRRPDLYGDEYRGRLTNVQAIRIDQFLEARSLGVPDVVKIDVEGHEPEVIEGLGELLNSSPTLLVEITEEATAERIAELTAGRGYVAYEIDEKEGVRVISRPRPSSQWNILLCTVEKARRLGLQDGEPF